MYQPKLKSVALDLPVSETIGST